MDYITFMAALTLLLLLAALAAVLAVGFYIGFANLVTAIFHKLDKRL